jgi:hypothetical protein
MDGTGAETNLDGLGKREHRMLSSRKHHEQLIPALTVAFPRNAVGFSSLAADPPKVARTSARLGRKGAQKGAGTATTCSGR